MKKQFRLCLIFLALLSIPAHTWAGLSKSLVSQLYVAVFNRASEGEGNAYWQNLEMDMATTADVMLQTDAAKNYFGTSLDSSQAFIEHIYLNTLNKTRAEDPDGVAYWVGLLEGGLSRGAVVAALVTVIGDYAPDGPYYDPSDGATITAYNQFINRVSVCDYMAETVSISPDGWETSTRFDAVGLNVTDYTSSVSAAKNAIDNFNIPPPACIDLDGMTYRITEVISLQNCGGTTDYDSFDASITQNGCRISCMDSYGIWGTGTVSGNQATISSSWYEAGGKVDAVYTVTFTSDKRSFQGSGTGTWTDGSFTCHPSSRISGTNKF